jgi:hypothetical protein
MTLISNKRPSAASANNVYQQEQRESWPCLIYRLQSHRGWEVFCPTTEENGNMGSISSGKKAAVSNKKISQSQAMEEELTVAPRKGSIEVRKMRLRVKLFDQGQPRDISNANTTNNAKKPNPYDEEQNNEDHENNNSDFVGADGWNNNALVVRRKDSIKSVQECMEFCDRLIYLNQDYFMPQSSSKVNHNASIIARQNEFLSGMDQRELYVDGMRLNKRRKADMIGDQLLYENDNVARGNREEDDAIAKQYRRKDELLSYIVKLAHDEDFLGFVDELERGLETAGDSAGIFRSLQSSVAGL